MHIENLIVLYEQYLRVFSTTELKKFSSAIAVTERLSVCVGVCMCVCVCVNNLNSKTAEPIALMFGGNITYGV